MKSIRNLFSSIKENLFPRVRRRVDAVSDRLSMGTAAPPMSEEQKAAASKLTPPDPETGLTDQEAAERISLGLKNDTDTSGIRSTRQIIVSHTFTWFNMLNLFLGALIFLTGQYKHMLFLGIVVCNSVIGIVQELRVRNLIQGLNVITASSIRVRRNGTETSVTVSDVVRDDIILLEAGDQIVADGTALSTSALEVNESMLTGEAKPVRKKDGDKLLSGSFVVAGSAVMRADAVGSEAYAAQLVSKARNRNRASSEMLDTIRRIIRIVSVVIIPIGILLFFSQRSAAMATAAAQGFDSQWVFNQSIILTVSGIIGMIPEGFVLLTSISFILGVGRLALKRALVQEMEAIEALARADILCTDKTGTITTGELKVSRLVTIGDTNADRIRSIMAHIGGALREENPTGIALDQYFGRKNDWTVTERIPFSSERKYKAAAFAEYGAYVVGAPEYLAPGRSSILNYVQQYAEKGYRCLLLCSSDGISSKEELTGVLKPLSIIVISDVIRPDAKETFAYFARVGVHVKVLSGDHPATVSAVAAAAGVEGAADYIDAGDLPEDPEKLREVIRTCTVFGRIKPEQKQVLIRAWQDEGHTVAMVGDGVNDVLALKDADCGIAMAQGSDAARHAAHIVLIDSDFARMQDIVGEGKTIICNIERVSSLYLTKTIYVCILCVLFILLQRSYPWTTLQMGLINLVGIGMPSFLLTLERHNSWKSGGFLAPVLKISLPAALTMVTTILVLLLAGRLFGWPHDMQALFNVLMGGFISLLVVFEVSRPLNVYRCIIWALCIAVFCAALIFLPGFYDIHPLFTPWSLLGIPFAFMVGALLYGFNRLTAMLGQKYLLRKEQQTA